jgi:hypothetical protein
MILNGKNRRVSMMRIITALLISACLTQWALGDILYTRSGEAITGQVEEITKERVQFRISRGGFEYEIRSFPIQEILEILDDDGEPIPFQSESAEVIEPLPTEADQHSPPQETASYRFSLTKTYSRWPLLVGTAAFTTVGIVKLSRASSKYDDIRRDEALGYEVTARKDEAAKERLWGELAVAAGTVCLVLALTPEKVRKPLLQSVRPRDDWSGIAWTFNLP